MVNKIFGYILIALGAIAVLLSYSGIRTTLNISLPSGISELIIMLIGIILLFIGAFLTFKKTNKQIAEVPIYEGQGKKRRIVAYQRH